MRVYAYGRNAERWWQDAQSALARPDNLTVVALPPEATQALAGLAQRTMQIQCTVQDGTAWVTDGARTVEIAPVLLNAARKP